MNWQAPAQATPPAVTPSWALEADPSANTKYVAYNNGDGTYTALVVEKQGTANKTTMIGQDTSLPNLEALCDKDWATGARK